MTEPSYLTVRQICQRLTLAKSDSVLSAIRSGDLAAVNVSAGKGRPTWRIAPDDFERFLVNRRAVPAVKLERRTRRRKLVGVTEFF